MFRINILLIIGGAALLVMGIKEWKLSSTADLTPQNITCNDLSEKGPGDNAHIVLTEFLVCDFAYVYEAKKGGSSWSTVWVPLIPVGGKYHMTLLSLINPEGTFDVTLPMPEDIKVIVKSSEIERESDLEKLSGETLSGMVVNQVESLGSDEQRILTESYPGVDFTDVWVIEHGRKPATPEKMFGMMGGGGALIAVAVGLFTWGRRSDQSPEDKPANEDSNPQPA